MASVKVKASEKPARKSTKRKIKRKAKRPAGPVAEARAAMRRTSKCLALAQRIEQYTKQLRKLQQR